MTGCIISLNDNNRCEPSLLHSHVGYVQKGKKTERSTIITISNSLMITKNVFLIK